MPKTYYTQDIIPLNLTAKIMGQGITIIPTIQDMKALVIMLIPKKKNGGI